MALEFIVVSVRARAMTCSAFSFTELSVLNGPWPSAVGMNLPISQAPCTKLGCREFGYPRGFGRNSCHEDMNLSCKLQLQKSPFQSERTSPMMRFVLGDTKLRMPVLIGQFLLPDSCVIEITYEHAHYL